MATDEIFGRYKRYKFGTRNIAYWLTRTAAQCIDLASVIAAPLSPSSASADYKSTQQQQQQHKNTKTDQRSTQAKAKRAALPKIEISSAELVKLAEAILMSNKPVDVPEGIILTVEDVITWREQSAEWYNVAPGLEQDDTVAETSRRHEHFIEVLRTIHAILCKARARTREIQDKSGPADVASGPKKKTSKKAKNTLTSIFDCLSLEEPTLDPLGAEPSLPASKVPVKFELEKTFDNDTRFEMWCFLQDIADVRAYLKRVWQSFRAGDTSFIAAGLLTDTAFGLLRSADEVFRESRPHRSTEWHSVIQFLGLQLSVHGEAVALQPVTRQQGAHDPSSITDHEALLCPRAFLCLQSYQKDAKLWCETDPKPIAFQPHNMPSFHPLKQALYHLLCQLEPEDHETSYRQGHYVRDEFVRGLSEIHYNGQIQLWMVAACDVYMDLYDMLGKHVSCGTELLRGTYSTIKQRQADVEAYSKKLGALGEVKSALAGLKRQAKWVETIEDLWLARINDTIGDEPRGRPVSRMEGYLPAYTGQYLFDLRIGLYEFGSSFVDYDTIVLSLAHLYRSLRAQGSLSLEWQDMNFVIQAFGKKLPLVASGDKAYDGEQAFRHYLLALGLSPTEFASNPSNRSRNAAAGTISWKNEARKMEVSSPLLQALIRRRKHNLVQGTHHNRTAMLQAVLQGLAAKNADVPISKKSPTSRTQPKFTPVQLLETMEKRLAYDEPALNFDWISFTLSCERLLENLAHDFASTYKPGMDSQDDCHHGLVCTIMRVADMFPAVTQEVANVLRSHIEAEGKLYVKQAYDQSSGRIPKHLRPSVDFDDESKLLWAGMKKNFDGMSQPIGSSRLNDQIAFNDLWRWIKRHGRGEASIEELQAIAKTTCGMSLVAILAEPEDVQVFDDGRLTWALPIQHGHVLYEPLLKTSLVGLTAQQKGEVLRKAEPIALPVSKLNGAIFEYLRQGTSRAEEE